ncbi:MAG: dephospho-CoA kinase [Bacteroidetes bacterium]|nr:dephospho-CoA kinase [Bacteroidota bacterium]
MMKVAITGNIGTGKSTVCRIFESLGVQVYYADKKAKKFYLYPEVIRSVKQLFGNSVFDHEDKLIRSELAMIVFNDPVKLKQLNAIIHPLVLEDVFLWADKHAEQKYILYESALLFESGFVKHFDKSILVTAPAGLSMQRVLERDHITKAEFLARVKNQMDQSEKEKLADFIIPNDEKEALIPRVILMHEALSA